MKILLTHRYFLPDSPPYGAILHDIGADLARDGHEVHVFSTLPSYRAAGRAPRRERKSGMEVRRMRVFVEKAGGPLRRGANVGLYCAGLFAEVLRVRPDVVTASTFPPVVAACTAGLAAKITGAKFVYHMQDVHPEVSEQAGGAMGRGALHRMLRAMDRWAVRQSAAAVVLSPDMAATLEARGDMGLPLHVVNNFGLESDECGTLPEGLEKPEGVRRVIFAGNLGRFQNLALLAEGIGRVLAGRGDVELMFLGDGAAEAELKARWGDHRQVRFAPFLPFAEAREVIRRADVGLVSLSEGIYRVSYPSKLSTYLGLGLPALVLVEPGSALARDVEGEGVGTVPTEATPEAIAEALERLLDGPCRKEAVSAWQVRNGRGAILKRWRALFRGLERGAASREDVSRHGKAGEGLRADQAEGQRILPET